MPRLKPKKIKSKIFLDGGDPGQTRELLSLMGWLDGQTTNPSLIAKNPAAEARLARGERFRAAEVLDFYRGVVEELSGLLPRGSISIEVYADAATRADAMLAQGQEMFGWIPNAHIKYPTTPAGLQAAAQSVKAGLRVNLTLCFSQAQAAAVYAATRGAARGQVFVSPFVGRLDDRGENGMDLIKNILQMYRGGDGHVEVLTASVRTMEHFLYALQLGSDIITAPFKILQAWGRQGMPMPDARFAYQPVNLTPMPYQSFDLAQPWQAFDLRHDLTDIGIQKFSADWNNLIKK